MRLYKKLFISFILLLFTGYLSAKDIPAHPKLVKGSLQNGLTYYIYPNDYPKGEAVYRLFIKSGSINETPEQRGLAHFLEHMAFNGTKHFPGNELVKFLESKGAKFGRDLNAHTSYNETVYKLKLPTNTDGMVDTTLTILADWLDGLLLEADEIDSERGVIMSEWLSKQKPEAEVNDVLLDALMNGSRFAERKVIGDTAIIQHSPYETLRGYYSTWYRPGLAAVAVVGDVDPVKVENLIHAKFSGMEKRDKPESGVYSIPDYENVEAKIVVNDALKKTELTVIQLVPRSQAVRNESDYSLYLQRTILNRLFRNRLNTLSFTNDAYSKGSIGISDFLNTKGVLMASVELVPGRVEEGISVFISQLSQIYQYGFVPEEIEKVKKALLNARERAAKSEQPVNSSQLMEEVYADFYKDYTITTPQEEYRLTKKYINEIDSVSITGSLQQLVKTDHMHYIFSSFEKEDMADSLRLIQFVDSIQSETIEPYQLKMDIPSQLLEDEPTSGRVISEKKIPAINGVELMLSNGIRVIYKESVSGKERISISAYKKGGLYSLDSVDYVNGQFSPGVVSLSGAGSFSRDELSYFLAGNSASVRLLIENTRTGMVGSASLDDIETLFQLIYLKWTQPKVDSSVFEMTKKRAIENYRHKNITDETVFYQDLNYLMRGKDYVTREMTDSIIEEQLHFKKMLPVFHRFFGDAGGFTFVIISDSELGALVPYINNYIGSLPAMKDDTEVPFMYDGGKIETSSAQLVRRAGDADRTIVSLIFQHTDLQDRKKVYDLKSNIASGVVRMKLLSELREKMGMVYSVGVSGGARKYPAELARNTISFTCNTGNYLVLIDKTKTILQEMIENPHSYDTEIENIKLSLVNDMAANVQKDSYWSSFIRNSTFEEDEEWNYVSNFRNMVDNITNEDISKFLSQYYNINNMIEAVLLPKNN